MTSMALLKEYTTSFTFKVCCLFCKQRHEVMIEVVISTFRMKKVNKQCLLDTPHTVRVSEKTW